MAEEMEEDLFADLYDGDENATDTKATIPAPSVPSAPVQMSVEAKIEPGYGEEPDTAAPPDSFEDFAANNEDTRNESATPAGMDTNRSYGAVAGTLRDEPLQMKEDGKMFIGGLNWETTDQSLYDYFSQFGEVAECTVMRDGASGRSRGFGFLTFKDPKVVNTVMVKEHFLDGKIIDPKRAIPRDEQEKTSKIFVGGVSQDATEDDFTAFFAQFGRVVDATLMMDKDTGRPRGFGFVTFDSEAAVERVLEFHPLEILGKPIEVKKAQPRGKMGEEEHEPRGGGRKGKFGREERYENQQSNQNQPQQSQNAMAGNGMTPQMMAQYWQKMQQYFAMMQSSMAMGGMSQMNQMNQMNPMMAQMQQMQQMQGGGGMQGMTPQMQQQMMQMMQMQNGMGMGGNQRNVQRPQQGFSAQEQQMFEQQKYEQQTVKRSGGHHNNRGDFNNQNVGGPQSWEGMYDGEPQPDDGSQSGRGSVGAVRHNTPGGSRPPKGPTPQPQSNAPVGAPTGPKNAGKPGANFRGGRGGGRFHPYNR